MAFERILAAWRRAAVNTRQADPFCSSPTWQLAFHEAFDPKRRLLVEHAPDGVLCFAENVFSPSNIYLTPIEAHWFFACPLLGKSAVDLLVKVTASVARDHAPHFPKILIGGLRPKSFLPRRLLQVFGKDFAVFLHSWGVQCAASLRGGVDGFLSRRSANFRSKLKKSRKRAAAEGICFEHVLPTSPEDASRLYARMLAVEEKSWKGIHACGMAEPPAREFYAAMMRGLSQSAEARVVMATHEGKDVGFIFGGMAGNIYRGQQFSYDDAWKEFSIGNIMQFEQIRRLCEEKAVRYDMGPLVGRGMDYKAHWTEKRMPIQCWRFEKK